MLRDVKRCLKGVRFGGSYSRRCPGVTLVVTSPGVSSLSPGGRPRTRSGLGTEDRPRASWSRLAGPVNSSESGKIR